jgi:hypothetical protein
MKKAQQMLAQPSVLARYYPPTSLEFNLLQASFMGLYSLEKTKDNDALVRAKASPDQFILKPQREGGGNCYDCLHIHSFIHSEIRLCHTMFVSR